MKYVAVTRASGGMGKETVNALNNNGYYVIALDKSIYQETNLNVTNLECDVTDEESVKKAYDKICSITNKLDAIIHFAGIYLMDSLVEIEYPKIEKIFKVNFFGAYLINKTFMPLLQKGSRVITITSELATTDPLPFTGIYGITKSALDKYCFSLRMELQLLGIDVSVIRAGAVKTNMLASSTKSLEEFCNKTKLYTCNAERFKNIVDKVETANVEPKKIAKKVINILECKHPKFAYSLNCNKYLKLLSKMPKCFQFWIIRKILK